MSTVTIFRDDQPPMAFTAETALALVDAIERNGTDEEFDPRTFFAQTRAACIVIRTLVAELRTERAR